MLFYRTNYARKSWTNLRAIAFKSREWYAFEIFLFNRSQSSNELIIWGKKLTAKWWLRHERRSERKKLARRSLNREAREKGRARITCSPPHCRPNEKAFVYNLHMKTNASVQREKKIKTERHINHSLCLHIYFERKLWCPSSFSLSMCVIWIRSFAFVNLWIVVSSYDTYSSA